MSTSEQPEPKSGTEFSPARRQVRVFVSFCHANEKLVKQVMSHLDELESAGLAKFWIDWRKLSPGTSIDEAILRELRISDLFLAMVSAPYLRSSYCRGIELREADHLFGRKSDRIIPVILSPCPWQSCSELKGHVALPHDARALTKFGNRDEGCLQIFQGVRAACARQAKLSPGSSEKRVLWELRGEQDLNAVGHRAVTIARLRIATRDPSLFCLRSSHGEYLTIESDKPALARALGFELKDLGSLLGVPIISIRPLEERSKEIWDQIRSGGIPAESVDTEEHGILRDDTGAILLRLELRDPDKPPSEFVSNRAVRLFIRETYDGSVAVGYAQGNLRAGSFVAAQEEIQDVWALLLELLAFEDDRIRASIHWDAARDLVDRDFSTLLGGEMLLEEDYLLKRLVSDCLSPVSPVGHSFWQSVVDKLRLDSVSSKVLFFAPIVSITTEQAQVYQTRVVKGESDTDLFEWSGNDPTGTVGHVVATTKRVIALKLNGTASPGSFPNTGLQQNWIPGPPNPQFQDVGRVGLQSFQKIVMPALQAELEQGWLLERMRTIHASAILATAAKRILRELKNSGHRFPHGLLSLVDSNDLEIFKRFPSSGTFGNGVPVGHHLASKVRFDPSGPTGLFATLGRWDRISSSASSGKVISVYWHPVGSVNLRGIDNVASRSLLDHKVKSSRAG